MKSIAISILFFFNLQFIIGQDLQFVSYTTEDNLSQSTVYSIVQDHQGFIWVGTDDGLNQFDGKNFKIFKNIPNNINSLSSNKINDLYVDSRGNLWIATDRGLNKYDPISQKITRFFLKPQQGEIDLNNYTKIYYDSLRNGFWLATNKTGFVFFNPEKDFFHEYNFFINNKNQKIHATGFFCQGDVLWIISDGGGLFSFNVLTKQMKNFSLPVKAGEDSLKINYLNVIVLNPVRHDLIIGSQNSGVYSFDTDLEEFKALPYLNTDNNSEKIRVKDFTIQGKKLWVATYGGLTTLNLRSERFGQFYEREDKIHYSLTTNRLTSLLLDVNKNLWIGSLDKGLDVYFPTRFKFPVLYPQNPGSRFSALAMMQINRNYVMVSLDEESVVLWNIKKNQLTPLRKNPIYANLHASVLSIVIDEDSVIWLGTWGGGLQRLDFKHKQLKTFLNSVSPVGLRTILSIYPEKGDSILWLATFGGGLVKYNKLTGQYSVYNEANGFSSGKIFSVTGNNSDTLWIGTMDGGFSIFNKKTGAIVNYLNDFNDPASLSSNVVNSIYDAGNKLWLATSNGLDIFDKTSRTFKSFFSGDGLPNDNLYSVLPEGDSAMWVSTNKGLSRITIGEDGNPFSFTNFDFNDGLQANEFNQGAFFKAPDGRMFFGGVKGLNYFYPNKISKNIIPPAIEFTSFKKFGQEVKLDTAIAIKKEIKLSYKENFLEFEFVALDYVFPSRNLYSFKMEGLGNSDWSIPSNRNYASFPNLVPGDYYFRVKASNGDGVWNNQGISLHIVISPPFYQRTSVITIAIILVLLGIYLFFRIRTRMIEREKRILEQKVKERTIELQQKNDDITSSIQYAKRIQEAILPNTNKFPEIIPTSFIFYKPKDIVSGDFFWYFKNNKKTYFAVADCTGHGVPGAFMSIIGNYLLDNIIKETKLEHPNEILNQLNIDIQIALNQQKEGKDINFDGMDIALCSLENNKLEYAAAFRPLIMIQDGKLNEIRGERFSIGGSSSFIDKKFKNHELQLNTGDWLYLFSDGYADQFGGLSQKKFMMRNFKELLLSIYELPPEAQKIQLEYSLNEWKKDTEQIDDILVMGINITE
ncbi:MAG: SpoIIE family protein phosphatase [Bacteroidales bacterium]|nr:SpoIIE family protein phosphatase [Bacteroidales bacterium]